MAIPQSGYQLLDFGNGRKLEQFGSLRIDRPCPAAANARANLDLWASAELIYDTPRSSRVQDLKWFFRGQWVTKTESIPAWSCEHEGLIFRIRPQRSGQVGLFPEHWEWWPWIQGQANMLRAEAGTEMAGSANLEPIRALHLFAYTGASSLAMAAMGMHVTHVDAMESAVAWAKENAALSKMEKLPIRWIVDDARAYVARELKRGKRYELIVLDPPSYGHGSKGQAWEIHRDLLPLLVDCCNLLSEPAIGIQLSGHSRDMDLKRLCQSINQSRGQHTNLRSGPMRLETAQAKLVDRAGRPLDCGYVARFLQ